MRKIELAKAINSLIQQIQKLNNEEHITDDWENLSDASKNLIYENIDKVLKNPDITPEQEHKIWMDYKLRNNWTYGVKKDPLRKTHPCLVDYKDLNFYQKLKDILVIEIIKLAKDDMNV
jgi:hypothetical protein